MNGGIDINRVLRVHFVFLRMHQTRRRAVNRRMRHPHGWLRQRKTWKG
jgi:hypothetical protein